MRARAHNCPSRVIAYPPSLHVGYAFVSGFSGVSLFNSLCVASYNSVLFVPIVFFALDYDVSASTALAVPAAYRMGSSGSLLNLPLLARWLVTGLWQSAVVLLLGLAGYAGRGYDVLGMAVFTAYLCVQSGMMLTSLHRVTAINIGTVLGAQIVALGVAWALNISPSAGVQDYIHVGSLSNGLRDGGWWAYCVLVTAACVLPGVAASSWMAEWGGGATAELYRLDRAGCVGMVERVGEVVGAPPLPIDGPVLGIVSPNPLRRPVEATRLLPGDVA